MCKIIKSFTDVITTDILIHLSLFCTVLFCGQVNIKCKCINPQTHVYLLNRFINGMGSTLNVSDIVEIEPSAVSNYTMVSQGL